MADSAEHRRLQEDAADEHKWRNWGTFLSERQWGTVREDYSASGNAWDYFPHEHARSRAYRWGEDGLFGWCDRFGRLNFSIALWNGKYPILKERLFGLTNSEGNHGEDVKELYYFLDGTPTCSYMKALYKYPVTEYPYDELVEVNKQRTKADPEFELIDSGIFNQGYFDVYVEYARNNTTETVIRITVENQSEGTQQLDLLGQLWFRNTWSWEEGVPRSVIEQKGENCFQAPTNDFGNVYLHFDKNDRTLFTENETNNQLLFHCNNASPYVKDAFHRFLIDGDEKAVNPEKKGSKSAVCYKLTLKAREKQVITLLLSDNETAKNDTNAWNKIVDARKAECDEFYEQISSGLDPALADIQRQAFAGLIWSKQQYHYNVKRWLKGDPTQPPPPAGRTRNANWKHVRVSDVMSMPDTWEYPWFAAWDLGFQALAFALIDPEFAKSQLILIMREWFMHPDGQIPAYEWAFGDVNPPVHAWAAWRIYTIDRRIQGKGDREFLERIFHKLLLNFTWWVNRKDTEGNNVFEGGFLGLDNIGVFDRNIVLPDGLTLEQSDGTSWMAIYCLKMLTIALELAKEEPAYEDVAIKFFEHFLLIAESINGMGPAGCGLWDDQDGFFYDGLLNSNGDFQFVKVRSAVGCIPLFAVSVSTDDFEKTWPNFYKHITWVQEHTPEYFDNASSLNDKGTKGRKLFSIVSRDQLQRIIIKLLDETEFLSDYGIRALSKYHKDHPYSITLGGQVFSVDYEPGESTTGQFGGNSNWRGPIWMPINFLIIEALQQYGFFYGDSLKAEMPTGSGNWVTLDLVAAELERRLVSIFTMDQNGNRPIHNGLKPYSEKGPWKDLVLFYEYFHGDSARGVGAAHQTGWTALIAKIIEQRYLTTYSHVDT